jgi:hypothetical protein
MHLFTFYGVLTPYLGGFVESEAALVSPQCTLAVCMVRFLFSRMLNRTYPPNVTHGRGSLPLVATCVSQCDWVCSANLVGS